MACVVLYSRRALESCPTHEEQLSRLRAWADAAGHEVIGEHSDDATDRKASTAPRPMLDKCCYDVARGAAEVIAVASLDRIARSPVHLSELLTELDGVGASLYVADIGIDTSTEAGKVYRAALSALLDMERKARTEALYRGVRRARAKGRPLGAKKMPHSLQARVEQLLLAGVKPNRVRSLTHIGGTALTRIRRGLEAAGKLRPSPPVGRPFQPGPSEAQRIAEEPPL